LQAELGDDAFDAALADGMIGLAQLLGDERRGSLPIQVAVADDLTDDFVSTAVVGFGAAALVLEGSSAAGFQARQQLIIARAGEAVLSGGGGGAQAFALALVEHDQSGEDDIVLGDQQGTAWPDQGELLVLDF
jgi:hypothetical protein